MEHRRPQREGKTYNKMARGVPAERPYPPFGTVCRNLSLGGCYIEKSGGDQNNRPRTGVAIWLLSYSHCIRLQRYALLHVSHNTDSGAAVAGCGSARPRLEPVASWSGPSMGAPRYGVHLALASGVNLDRSSCEYQRGAQDIAHGLFLSPSGA